MHRQIFRQTRRFFAGVLGGTARKSNKVCRKRCRQAVVDYFGIGSNLSPPSLVRDNSCRLSLLQGFLPRQPAVSGPFMMRLIPSRCSPIPFFITVQQNYFPFVNHIICFRQFFQRYGRKSRNHSSKADTACFSCIFMLKFWVYEKYQKHEKISGCQKTCFRIAEGSRNKRLRMGPFIAPAP